MAKEVRLVDVAAIVIALILLVIVFYLDRKVSTIESQLESVAKGTRIDASSKGVR
jgi:uncharacterized protein YoxC